MITRRRFIRDSSILAGALCAPVLSGCDRPDEIAGSLRGPDASRGHRVYSKSSGQPSVTTREDIVIVGGGVAGLAAARWLRRGGQSFVLLELEDEAGGNARAGRNEVSAYPLGAHYLPLPGHGQKELLTFLEECGVITGYENGLPVYNEYYLCFDPKERLFIHHHWQEGLVPHEGVPSKDIEQIQAFLNQMETYRRQIGTDGKEAFAIPVGESSRDSAFTALDRISMGAYLDSHRFFSPYLRWYISYCCADDYGASLETVSAWAGIHYFASRKGEAANARADDVLTWPEGNQWLVKHLQHGSESQIQKGAVTLSVSPRENHVAVDYLHMPSGDLRRVEAKRVILATPQFVNKHILRAERPLKYDAFQYAPWMVANLTVQSRLEERRGESLSWDNVMYGSSSLGYVHAQHQGLRMADPTTVITYYRPMIQADCLTARRELQQRDWAYWKETVFQDLKAAHPDLARQTRSLDVWLWGHGMIRPSPDFIFGPEREAASLPVANRIFFAHSDIGGISIFEEAFAQGVNAAKMVMSS